MKKRLIALMLLTGGFVFAQVSIGIQIGPPPPPRIVRVLPPRPGPEFAWVDGYWYPVGSHYRWHSGYWSRPVYPAARWVAPRHDGERFYHGYWDGERGRIEVPSQVSRRGQRHRNGRQEHRNERRES